MPQYNFSHMCCSTTRSSLYSVYCKCKFRWSPARCKTKHVLSHSRCEVSHILRVRGETFLRVMRANRNVCRLTAATVVIFLPQTEEGCSSECKKQWSTAQKERNHKTGTASALLIPPPFSFHLSPSLEFQMGMNVFLPAFLKAAY